MPKMDDRDAFKKKKKKKKKKECRRVYELKL
jgi:hypothetical protein